MPWSLESSGKRDEFVWRVKEIVRWNHWAPCSQSSIYITPFAVIDVYIVHISVWTTACIGKTTWWKHKMAGLAYMKFDHMPKLIEKQRRHTKAPCRSSSPWLLHWLNNYNHTFIHAIAVAWLSILRVRSNKPSSEESRCACVRACVMCMLTAHSTE